MGDWTVCTECGDDVTDSPYCYSIAVAHGGVEYVPHRPLTQPPPTQNTNEPPWPPPVNDISTDANCGGCVALQAHIDEAALSLGAELLARHDGYHYHAIDELVTDNAKLRDALDEIDSLATIETVAVVAIARRALGRLP